MTGVILALFPLIISALEHYNEGLKPLKHFIRYKHVVRTIVVDLGTQQVLFRNSLEKLLRGSVAGDFKLGLLLEHPGGKEWQDEKFTSDLEHRLQGSFSVYVNVVKDIENLMEILQEKIGLDSNGKVWTTY